MGKIIKIIKIIKKATLIIVGFFIVFMGVSKIGISKVPNQNNQQDSALFKRVEFTQVDSVAHADIPYAQGGYGGSGDSGSGDSGDSSGDSGDGST